MISPRTGLALLALALGCGQAAPVKSPRAARRAYGASHIGTFTDSYSITGLADGGTALWANTNQGLVRWDVAQNRYGAFTAKDGVPAGALLGITMDRDGAVWVASQKGVARGTRTGWKPYPPAPVGEFIVGLAAFGRAVLLDLIARARDAEDAVAGGPEPEGAVRRHRHRGDRGLVEVAGPHAVAQAREPARTRSPELVAVR